MRIFSILAKWDPEANVWVATSEDVPGLATEAASVGALFEKLRFIVPELLEANTKEDLTHASQSHQA